MSVATDGNTYYYIKQDGSLWGFGASYGGQLGYIETYSFETYDYLSSMSNYTLLSSWETDSSMSRQQTMSVMR